MIVAGFMVLVLIYVAVWVGWLGFWFAGVVVLRVFGFAGYVVLVCWGCCRWVLGVLGLLLADATCGGCAFGGGVLAMVVLEVGIVRVLGGGLVWFWVVDFPWWILGVMGLGFYFLVWV